MSTMDSERRQNLVFPPPPPLTSFVAMPPTFVVSPTTQQINGVRSLKVANLAVDAASNRVVPPRRCHPAADLVTYSQYVKGSIFSVPKSWPKEKNENDDDLIVSVYGFLKSFIGASGTNQGAIDNRIEQAMDLVKSHLMNAVRSEVEEMKEKIVQLEDTISTLQSENDLLRANVPSDVLLQIGSNNSGAGAGNNPTTGGSLSLSTTATAAAQSNSKAATPALSAAAAAATSSLNPSYSALASSLAAAAAASSSTGTPTVATSAAPPPPPSSSSPSVVVAPNAQQQSTTRPPNAP